MQSIGDGQGQNLDRVLVGCCVEDGLVPGSIPGMCLAVTPGMFRSFPSVEHMLTLKTENEYFEFILY